MDDHFILFYKTFYKVNVLSNVHLIKTKSHMEPLI